MSTTVFPQLQTIEAELVSQTDQLEAQLASVREKLISIRTVLPMFAETAGITAEPALIEALPTASVMAAPTVADALEPTKTKETTPKKTVQKKAATPKKATAQKKATSKKAASKKAPAKKATAKKDGRTASWQKYTRPGVKNESIPDAVRLILATQPENEFKIVDVMDALFKEDMPKDQYLKARNRISNVLSGGVRAGDWYKGERGTYRMSDA